MKVGISWILGRLRRERLTQRSVALASSQAWNNYDAVLTKYRYYGVSTAFFILWVILSVFQAADRNYKNSVFTLIGIWAYGSQNHKERRLFHSVGIYFCGESLQCLCAIFYKFLTTQFYFYESVAAITQMNNGIALQSVFVAFSSRQLAVFHYGSWR